MPRTDNIHFQDFCNTNPYYEKKFNTDKAVGLATLKSRERKKALTQAADSTKDFQKKKQEKYSPYDVDSPGDSPKQSRKLSSERSRHDNYSPESRRHSRHGESDQQGRRRHDDHHYKDDGSRDSAVVSREGDRLIRLQTHHNYDDSKKRKSEDEKRNGKRGRGQSHNQCWKKTFNIFFY